MLDRPAPGNVGSRRRALRTLGLSHHPRRILAHDVELVALIGNRKQSIAKSDLVLLPGNWTQQLLSRLRGLQLDRISVAGRNFWLAKRHPRIPAVHHSDDRRTRNRDPHNDPNGEQLRWSHRLAFDRIGTKPRLPAALPAFPIGGGAPAGIFTIPIRATYRHGVLWNLSVNDASLAGGYRFAANTVRTGFDAPNVMGVLVNGGIRVASLAADAFGNGTLTITSTGAQYRLIDWTIVR